MSIEAINATSRRSIVRPTYAELSARRGAAHTPATPPEPIKPPAHVADSGPVEAARAAAPALPPVTYGADLLRAMEKLTACHGESNGTP